MINIMVAKQLARFMVIGGVAALLHMGVVIAMVQYLQWQPLSANGIGFLSGFQVSYWGHRNYTFNNSNVQHKIALPKLLVLQIINFMINEYLFYFLLQLGLPYQLALLLVLAIMPIFTFVISKNFIFYG